MGQSWLLEQDYFVIMPLSFTWSLEHGLRFNARYHMARDITIYLELEPEY
jgi:hypothetical protein